MPVPQLQLPNTAAMFINQQIAGQASTDRRDATANIAKTRMAELTERQRVATNAERLEAYQYAGRLLSSVNSAGDWEIAKKILQARYPDKAEGLKQLMSEYSPQAAELLRNSLRSEAQKLELSAPKAPDVKFAPMGSQPFVGGVRSGEQIPFKPTAPKTETKASLTAKALKGDAEARNILNDMIAQAGETAQASSKGKIEGLMAAIDLEGAAQAITEGRETIENVRNTFGVPIQETVRKKVLAIEPDFNFVQPRAIYASLKSSMMQQQKNRGMMGSFVKNINKQVDKLDTISRDIVSRVGIRALDLPKREFITRFIGSGHERVFEAYMKEVSAEIAKLAQGSAASIAQLPEENRKEWERIHDVNLSMKELLTILRGTKEMANIRLQSVQDELDVTVERLRDVRASKKRPIPKDKPLAEWSDMEIMRLLRGK